MLGNDWDQVLEEEINKDYFKNLEEQIYTKTKSRKFLKEND